MTYRFLTGTYSNMEQLKKAYFRLAMIHHPDRGGNLRDMQQLNDEYTELSKRFESGNNSSAGGDTGDTNTNSRGSWGYQEGETAQEFIRIINELLKLDGIKIEICGCWIWITGDTYTNRDALKALGCKWCRKKQAWSWHPVGAAPKSHKTWDMDKIRSTYGSNVISDKRRDTNTNNSRKALR